MSRIIASAMLRKIRKALKCAADTMDYCAGDAWEREVTKKDRDTFDKLSAEIIAWLDKRDRTAQKSVPPSD